MGWGPRLVAASLAATPWAELGAVHFRLPRPENPGETEVTAGVGLEVAWAATTRWSLSVGLARRWTFTEPVLDRTVWSVALGRALPLPVGVAEALADPDPPGRPGRGGPSEPRAPRLPGRRPATASPSASVASPGELAVLGARRTAAMTRRLPGWAVATVDAVTVAAAPTGEPGFAASGLSAEVDGWPIPLGVLGVTAPDRLPVEPTTMDAVEGAGVLEGAPSPTLRVRTRRPPPGPSLVVDAATANATGDPGPHELAGGGGPNVESLGWDAAGSAAWTGTALAGRVEGSVRRRWVSEQPVFRRNFEAVDSDVRWPWVEVARGRAAFSLDRSGRYAAWVGGSRVDDFFLLPGTVREVPAVTTLGAVVARAVLPPTSLGTLEVGAGTTASDLEVEPNRLGRSLEWRRRENRLRVRLAEGASVLSLEAVHRSEQSGGTLADRGDGVLRVGGESRIHGGPGEPASVRVAGSLLRADGRWGGDARVAVAGAGPGTATWGLDGAWAATPPALTPGPWLQVARGLDVFRRWGVGVEGDARPRERRRWTARLWLRRPLGDGDPAAPTATPRARGGWVEARLRADGLRGWTSAVPAVEVEGDIPVAGTVRVSPDARGTLLAGEVRYGWRLGGVRGEGWYVLRGRAGANPAMDELLDAVPRHTTAHRLTWWLRPDLAVAASAELRSGARWAGFPAAGTGGVAGGALAGGLRLDVGVRKRLWGDRVRLRAALSDLLDRELRHHPLGGRPGLTLRVGAEARLGAFGRSP